LSKTPYLAALAPAPPDLTIAADRSSVRPEPESAKKESATSVSSRSAA
jgi:hypothetical protein